MTHAPQTTIQIMPTTFGAAGGPRQAPMAGEFRNAPIRYRRFIVRHTTDGDKLQWLLPAGMTLRGTPMVQFHFFCLRDIPWLAGRGYNILSMMIPAAHPSSGTEAIFCAVMWENLGDPIVTGREQLGHPKLYAQIPEPREWNGKTELRAGWDGFTFAEMAVSGLADAGAAATQDLSASVGQGIVAHKYIPRSGQWDVADADYLTLSPVPGVANSRDPQPPPRVQEGTGTVRFNVPTWQDMPTQYHIVEQIAALPQIEVLPALVMEGTTYLDFTDQTILT